MTKKNENENVTIYTEIDVQIPFFKIIEKDFEGYLLQMEEREDNDTILLAETLAGEKVYLGGYSILKFYNNFYSEGLKCQIHFKGKVKSSNGRMVNDFGFAMEKI